jgi:radical SAM protein with 4Fe4S-binding SPASM domain
MRGELFFYKTAGERIILDSNSQLIWKSDRNLKSLEEIAEGKYSLIEFHEVIERIDDKEAKRFHSSLEKLSNLGFFQAKEKQMTKINSFDIDHIVINPTTKCNLDCWYCYSKEFRKINTEELDFEEIKEVILYFADRKKEYQSETSLLISLYYLSEVTLDFSSFLRTKEFIETIKQNYDFEIFLFPPPTNLLEIEEDFVDYMNEYGFLTVSIDYYNTNQIEEVLKNIETFDGSVIKHCIIPLHPQMNNLLEVYRRFMEVFDYVSLRPVRVGSNSKNPWKKESVENLDKEMNALCNQLLEMKDEELISFILSLGSSDYFNRYLQRVISRQKSLSRCSAGFSAVSVGPDSQFYPCSGFIGKKDFKLGTVKTGIDLTLMSKYDDFVNSNTLCEGCSIRFYCGGFCEDWKQMVGSIQESQQVECKINYIYFKNCSTFAIKLLENNDNILTEFAKEKGIDFRLSYPLNYDDFVSFFSAST